MMLWIKLPVKPPHGPVRTVRIPTDKIIAVEDYMVGKECKGTKIVVSDEGYYTTDIPPETVENMIRVVCDVEFRAAPKEQPPQRVQA